jgi:glutathione peroxidase
MQDLYNRYSAQGLVVMAFPCNQFGNQEAGTNEDIKKFAASYGARFLLMDKVNVNGPETHPVYVFLKKSKPSLMGTFIKWNFTKFLVNRHGHVYERYGPQTTPDEIQPDIERLINDTFEGKESVSSVVGERAEAKLRDSKSDNKSSSSSTTTTTTTTPKKTFRLETPESETMTKQSSEAKVEGNGEPPCA